MTNLSAVGATSIPLTKGFVSSRGIVKKDIYFGETHITVLINRKIWATAKKLSVGNDLLLSIPVKVEKDESVADILDKPTVSPLLSVNITERQDEINTALRSSNFYELNISYDTEIVFNKVFLTSQFFEVENDFFTKEIEGSEYPLTFGDLIPEKKRGTWEAFASLVGYFQPRDNALFKIELPKAKVENSLVMALFAEKQNIVIKRKLEDLKTKANALVKEYLLGTEESFDELEFVPSVGHYAKSFAMSEGQYKASRILRMMLNGDLKSRILSVFGPAGTGKSTFLHSAMDTLVYHMTNEVLAGKLTKTNLFVSTAYKAVTGVLNEYTSFMNGVTMVTGNQEYRTISKAENDKLIAELEAEEYDASKLSSLIAQRAKDEKKMETRLKVFNLVKKFKIHADFKNLKEDLNFQKKALEELIPDRDTQTTYNEAYFAILRIVGIKADSVELDEGISKVLSILESNKAKIKIAADRVDSQNLISSFFSKVTLELETGEFVKSEEDILLLQHYVETLDMNRFEEIIRSSEVAEKVSVIKMLIKMAVSEHGRKLIRSMIRCQSKEDFGRITLFDLSNVIGYRSKLILRQLALKNKSEVLRAIKLFSSAEPYRYLRGEYGNTRKSHEEFIHYVALVYPFIGTSIASINGIIPGLHEDITPYGVCLADEAGMITSIDMLGALQLSERAVIVGDPEQLQPIFTIDEMFASSIRTLVNDEPFWKKYSPMEVSAFHLASGKNSASEEGIGKAILLDEHRRCQPAIANLAKMIVPSYKDLKIETAPIKNTKVSNDLDKFNKIGSNLVFVNVKNSVSKRTEKYNLDEIAMIEKLLNRLEAIGFDLTNEVGIITPYATQAQKLTEKFATRLGQVTGAEPRIGTVHKFQGAEYKVIILSTVVSKDTDSLNFINNGPYMVNVAVTRAKNHLFVVGDYDKLTSDDSSKNYIGTIAKAVKKATTPKKED